MNYSTDYPTFATRYAPHIQVLAALVPIYVPPQGDADIESGPILFEACEGCGRDAGRVCFGCGLVRSEDAA